MNTASALFEVYKTLPKRLKREFKGLIKQEDDTLLKEIEIGLKQVRAIQEGKIPKKNARELLNNG
jgi:phage terminase Nu1 subunit (DNA packaging protein)